MNKFPSAWQNMEGYNVTMRFFGQMGDLLTLFFAFVLESRTNGTQRTRS